MELDKAKELLKKYSKKELFELCRKSDLLDEDEYAETTAKDMAKLLVEDMEVIAQASAGVPETYKAKLSIAKKSNGLYRGKCVITGVKLYN